MPVQETVVSARPRRRAGVVAAALLFALPALAAAAPAPADWVVVRASAATDGTTVTLTIRAVIESGESDAEPRYLGSALRTPDGDVIEVVPFGDGRVSATTTATLGGIDTPVVTTTSRVERRVSFRVEGLQAGEQAAIAMFVSGGEAVVVDVSESQVEAGRLDELRTVTGSGTRAVRAAGADRDGIGLGAGPVALGVTSGGVELAHAAIGAIPELECGTYCEVAWEGPDGRAGTWQHQGLLDMRQTDGVRSFVGPAGTWSFAWTGVAAPEPTTTLLPTDLAVAVLAPVGSAWPGLLGR